MPLPRRGRKNGVKASGIPPSLTLLPSERMEDDIIFPLEHGFSGRETETAVPAAWRNSHPVLQQEKAGRYPNSAVPIPRSEPS